MTAGSPKSIHNPCPVCGKPRGKGPDEYAHGACMEARAKTEGKGVYATFSSVSGKVAVISDDANTNAHRHAAAKRYKSGKKLPDWMYS